MCVINHFYDDRNQFFIQNWEDGCLILFIVEPGDSYYNLFVHCFDFFDGFDDGFVFDCDFGVVLFTIVDYDIWIIDRYFYVFYFHIVQSNQQLVQLFCCVTYFPNLFNSGRHLEVYDQPIDDVKFIIYFIFDFFVGSNYSNQIFSQYFVLILLSFKV